eukprot:3502767-Pleurochrysis_carterae.AAC.1
MRSASRGGAAHQLVAKSERTAKWRAGKCGAKNAQLRRQAKRTKNGVSRKRREHQLSTRKPFAPPCGA